MVGEQTQFDVAAQNVYVPLEFWFCRNPGLALPLIALQYHEVKVNLEFATLAEAGTISSGTTTAATGSISSASLWVDYIFLDTDERRRFAQLSHEYLIEQLQFTGEESVTASTANRVKLNFNHPVKELVGQPSHQRCFRCLHCHNRCQTTTKRPRPICYSCRCLLHQGSTLPTPHQHS